MDCMNDKQQYCTCGGGNWQYCTDSDAFGFPDGAFTYTNYIGR